MREPRPPKASARPDYRPPIIDAVCSGDIEHLKMFTPATGVVIYPHLGVVESVNLTDPVTGMSALHVAVGLNRLDMVKLLVELGARFFPDNEGRMPSLIAAECETSEAMQDYIADAERKAEADQ